MTEIREYLGLSGASAYGCWYASLDRAAKVRIARSLIRLAEGNIGRVKSVGAGVMELKVHFGPGYRVYFGWDGPSLILLLGGGSKKRQNKDIADAQERWRDYQTRKRGNSCH